MTGRQRGLTAKCRACHGPRQTNHYLCPTCWRTLPRLTRALLTQRAPDALARLRSLHTQIDAGIPLADIRIPNTTQEN